MGRSVSYAGGSVHRLYFSVDISESWQWDDLIDQLKDELRIAFPSLYAPDRKWLGREDRALLCNDHAYIGVSEYCGLVCVWMTPRHEHEARDSTALADNWIASVEARFTKAASRCFDTRLIRKGTMSNGEGVYALAS